MSSFKYLTKKIIVVWAPSPWFQGSLYDNDLSIIYFSSFFQKSVIAPLEELETMWAYFPSAPRE